MDITCVSDVFLGAAQEARAAHHVAEPEPGGAGEHPPRRHRDQRSVRTHPQGHHRDYRQVFPRDVTYESLFFLGNFHTKS